ncbi:hypothetical protein GVN21_14505 [Caulobacter sp. SLTY]|uniref:hypothetical protein n=1 Tax=Caulobacter sp. SLTY TaxID=2683262 RepID=UPI0014122F61|nr:hypothetical protein [Caulobacter sp. SLTY]NBB16571.1 hypothetical protein [Caulobacter sp. SLTY]
MSDSTEDMRLTGRAIGEFILRWAEVTGPNFGGDLTSAIIYTAVVQANIREVWNDPVLNRQYADVAPPNALRRPISISAIAASLNLPREMVRRHVGRMLDSGAMVKKDGGVIVPVETVDSPVGLEAMRLLHAAARRFVQSMRKAGVRFADSDGE